MSKKVFVESLSKPKLKTLKEEKEVSKADKLAALLKRALKGQSGPFGGEDPYIDVDGNVVTMKMWSQAGTTRYEFDLDNKTGSYDYTECDMGDEEDLDLQDTLPIKEFMSYIGSVDSYWMYVDKKFKNKIIELISDEQISESVESYIYLFPDEEAMGDYKSDVSKFNLVYLGKNKFEDENNLVVKGSKENLEKYADYLGYELHPDYLYKEEDFAGDIINESVSNSKLDSELDKVISDDYIACKTDDLSGRNNLSDEERKELIDFETECGNSINPKGLTYRGLLKLLVNNKGEDFDYNDSAVREFAFSVLSRITGFDYDYFYNAWLNHSNGCEKLAKVLKDTNILVECDNNMNKEIIKEDTKEKTFGDNVREAIKVLKGISPSVFYTALGIYEWTGKENPTDEECEMVDGYLDGIETIYDEWVRGEVQDMIETGVSSEEEPEEKSYSDVEDDEDTFFVDKPKKVEEEALESGHIEITKPVHDIAKKVKKVR